MFPYKVEIFIIVLAWVLQILSIKAMGSFSEVRHEELRQKRMDCLEEIG